jgi:F-type H+-transporting ATPase subunit b
MDATLQALGQLILQALPTFFLVLLLFFYLKAMFFGPMERILAQRDAATVGARKSAEESLKRAEAKAAAYEEQLRAARNEIYREQEEQRRQWQAEQSQQLITARANADQSIKAARAQIQAETEEARTGLRGNVQSLAEEITRAVLQGSAR